MPSTRRTRTSTDPPATPTPQPTLETGSNTNTRTIRRSTRNIKKPTSYHISIKVEPSSSPTSSTSSSIASCDEEKTEDTSMSSGTPSSAKKRHPQSSPTSGIEYQQAAERIKKLKILVDEVPESEFENTLHPLPMIKVAGNATEAHNSLTLVTKQAREISGLELVEPMGMEGTPSETLSEKPSSSPPPKRKGGRPRKSRKRGRPKRGSNSPPSPPSPVASPSPPPSPAPLPSPVTPGNYTLPPSLLHESLIPIFAALIESAMSYYCAILSPENSNAVYLPANPKAWQTFVATPFFQMHLGRLEQTLSTLGVAFGGDGNEESLDVKTECKAVCQRLWGAILQMNSGGEEVLVRGFLGECRGEAGNGNGKEKSDMN
ncbi:hypothetical protein K440DRAFT_249728 [Wilcoxina mikolae CBS 423.85]|nr:hypothetical protein K440DRAFT_249728 [Wilcoxina mikolae CBS 423.85]